MEKLSIIYLPTDALTPYSKNARKHSEADIKYIKNSIEENGFLDPIGVWGEKNIIVEGHGRLIAAKELGIDSVPCIRLDHLTDEQRREYALAHNKTAEMSSWDFDALENELSGLEGLFDMSDFGFVYKGSSFSDYSPVDDEEKVGDDPYSYDEGYADDLNQVGNEELAEYSGNAESLLAKKRVIITYDAEDEGELCGMLGLKNGIEKIMYDFSELANEG